MHVRDVMTHRVDFVSRTDTAQEAAQKMMADNVGLLPVFDGDIAVGMVTDRDITVRCVARGCNPARTCVSEVMTPEVFICADYNTLGEAAALMEEKQVRRLLVKNGDGHVVGVLSLADLARGHVRDLAARVLARVTGPARPQW